MTPKEDWKSRLGIVYSTNPDFAYPSEEEEVELLPPARQKLRVHFERAGRGGKTATIVSGFQGPDADLASLAKQLKSRLGIGGSAKDGEIILQGNVCERAVQMLKSLGYTGSK